MKVLLTIDNPPILSGYTVLSPLTGHNILDLSNLDDAECDEIICDNILNYCPIEHLYSYLELLSKKLAHNGKLNIISNDAISITSEYYHSNIDTSQYNILMFGSKQHAWDFKQSAISLNEIYEILTNLGLKIINKKLHNLKFCISAERE